VPLVLASNDRIVNDRYHWKDVTGVQYHYPNSYRNLIRPGERFIYYRGVRRANGARGQAEYFGLGSVGDVWRDTDIPPDTPKKNWAWYCEIEDYVPFASPVPAKLDGILFETLKSNDWRNGVRKLSEDVFNHILATAGVPTTADELDLPPAVLALFDVGAVEIREVAGSLMSPPSKRLADGGDPHSGFKARRSPIAKAIGDRAEEIIFRYIRETVAGATAVRHVAADGETPGWDIEYQDANGELNAVEVKAASGSAFANFELTQGELNAARRLRRLYWVYLLADCLSSNGKLERIQDPAALLDAGRLKAEPIAWRIWRL